ncbi:MAG: hypothetical protein ACRD1C_03090 [Terriglobales bacterium]
MKRSLAALAAYLFLLAQAAPAHLLAHADDPGPAHFLLLSLAGQPRLALAGTFPFVRLLRAAAAAPGVEPTGYPAAAAPGSRTARPIIPCSCSSAPPTSAGTGGAACQNPNSPAPPEPVTTASAGHTTTCTSLCHTHVSATIIYPIPPGGGGVTSSTSCGYGYRTYCSSSCLRLATNGCHVE